jgi:hypothetical protein
MNYPFRYGPNTLLLNDHGTRLHDAEYVLGVANNRGQTTLWIEEILSGWLSTIGLPCLPGHFSGPSRSSTNNPAIESRFDFLGESSVTEDEPAIGG